MDTGIPSCAVTAIEGTSVLMIVSAAHLDHPAQ